MVEEIKRSPFGYLLWQYRRNCTDPERGGGLTQARLAELLEVIAGVPGYSDVRVSNWERGSETIRHDRRDVLVGLIQVLVKCGGISTLLEANRLLATGGYRRLNEDEMGQIREAWLVESDLPASASSSNSSEYQDDFAVRQSIISIANSNMRQLLSEAGKREAHTSMLFPSECGETPLNLGRDRLHLSHAFGTYFASLLERPHHFVHLDGQIECPSSFGQESVPALERILYTLNQPTGKRILIIAADGGMGKSTLAARLIRCLFQQQAIDIIIGDSAKTEMVDPVTGIVQPLVTSFYDMNTFYRQLCLQLSLLTEGSLTNERTIIREITDRLAGRDAILMVDNLETVSQANKLLSVLTKLTNKHCRAIVTTRKLEQRNTFDHNVLIVHLRPIVDLTTVHSFLEWHIKQYQEVNPRLVNLSSTLQEENYIRQLVERTGGVPLLLQLVISDVARLSWDYLLQMPHLFNQALLQFLYRTRWQELIDLGSPGLLARKLLQRIAIEQFRGSAPTFNILKVWAEQEQQGTLLAEALTLLYERFMIVNHDMEKGHFTVFPSLTEFLKQA